MKWSKEWPKEEGTYWFYGYRYGKFFGKEKNKPELCLVIVHKTSNGLVYSTDGQFMYKSETEDEHFLKVILPNMPNM